MFNVGVIGSRRAAPNLVQLTNRQIPFYYMDYGDGYVPQLAYFALTWDGRGYNYVQSQWGGTEFQFWQGQWYRPGQTPSIGEDYEVLVILLSGSYPTEMTIPMNTWSPVNLTVGWQNSGGRVSVAIRKKGTTQVLASAQFWTPGY